MKKNIIVLLVGLFLSFNSYSAEYLVKYKHTPELNSFADDSSFTVEDYHSKGKLLKVDIPDNGVVNGLISLNSNPDVEYIIPNYEVYAVSLIPSSIPSFGPSLQNQWSMGLTRAEEAWKKAGNIGSSKVAVALVDTGVDYNHQSLAPNIKPGWDFVDNNNNPMDKNDPGHGTHCAGIMGATGLVSNGVEGVSPNVSIVPLRVLDADGVGHIFDVIKAIDYATTHNVQIISMSIGFHKHLELAKPLVESIERADKAGIVVVVAASNDGLNNDTYEVYPAKAGTNNLISVAASDVNDGKPGWSNFGRATVSIAAPGDDILSTLPGGKYGLLSGTSMATPFVSGLVAFLKAQDDSLSPDKMRSLLQASGDPVDIDTACDCRVNALSATKMLLDKKMFVHPFATTLAPGATKVFTAVFGKAPFSFEVSNPEVASIDSDGTLHALSIGNTRVTVTDANNNTASSYYIYVANPGTSPEAGPPTTTGLPSTCPADEISCRQTCDSIPTLPWCSSLNNVSAKKTFAKMRAR